MIHKETKSEYINRKFKELSDQFKAQEHHDQLHIQYLEDKNKELREALTEIEKLCNADNELYDHIWHIASNALTSPNQSK